MSDQQFLNDFKRQHIDAMTRFDGFNGQIKLANNFTSRTCRTIVEICLWLRSKGYAYSTEVKMKHYRKRADIVVPELYGSQVIEVHDTEGIDSIEAKQKIYADNGIEMLAVPASDDGRVAIFEIAAANHIYI